jgi:hypothetical protein
LRFPPCHEDEIKAFLGRPPLIVVSADEDDRRQGRGWGAAHAEHEQTCFPSRVAILQVDARDRGTGGLTDHRHQFPLPTIGVISMGALSAVEARASEAVEPAVEEACALVNRAAVKHTEGTWWLRSGKMLTLWTIATSVATVFKILPNGKADTLKALYAQDSNQRQLAPKLSRTHGISRDSRRRGY